MSPQDPGRQWPGQEPWPSQQPWGQGQQPWPSQQPWGQGQQPWGQPPHPGPPSDPGGAYPGGQNGPYGQPRYVAPPKPGIIPLRPLMFGEILDGSFQSIRRSPKAMLGAALLAQSLTAILVAVVTAVTATSASSIEAWADTAGPEELATLGIGFFGAFLLVMLLTIFMAAVLQGAMVVPVARSILNRPTGFRRMWELSRARAGALVRLALLLLAAGAAAFVLLAVLGVGLVSALEGTGALLLVPVLLGAMAVFTWIAIKLLVAPAAVVVEELGALAALRRSWDLTRSNWWRIFGITLVVSFMVGVVSQVVVIPVTLLMGVLTTFASPHGGSGQAAAAAVAVAVATAVVGALVGALGYAFQTSVMALLYMDLRMRKDGLDIVLLRLMESGTDPDGVPGRGTAPGLTGGNGVGPAGGTWPDVR